MAGAAGDAGGLLGSAAGSFLGPFGSALGGGLGKGLGAALGGDGGGPLVSGATAATYGTTLGNDGWVLNFGSGAQWSSPTSTAGATYAPDQTPNMLGTLLPAQQAGYSPPGWIIVAVLAAVAWKFYRGKS